MTPLPLSVMLTEDAKEVGAPSTEAGTAINYASASLPPILVRQDDIVLMKRAVDLTGLSDKTIRRYFETYRLGARTMRNSPLRISLPGLTMVLHGDFEALELLREGQRDHPRVSRYLRELGLPD